MKTLRLSLLLCVLGTVPLCLWAGSADAVIAGKTESGRTQIDIRVGDIDGLIRSVRMEVDGETLLIKDADSLPQTVIRDTKNGVYVLSVTADEKVFRLWMIPGTEKVTDQSNTRYRSRFAAVVQATDPREEQGQLTPKITIGCHLSWEI